MSIHRMLMIVSSSVCLWVGLVAAQSAVMYDFEDGRVRGASTSMQVPPKILTESNNQFMRITGSQGDCGSMPRNLCPPRNRSTVRFTSGAGSMPTISTSTMRQTYSAKIRFHENRGIDGSVFELFQAAPGGESYGKRNGSGPVVRLWRAHGKVSFTALYANETKQTRVVRTVNAGAWHTYTVNAVWSHDPAVGRLEFLLDGTRVMLVTGRDVNLGPASNRIPEMKMGLYGDNAVGFIDVDNVVAGPSGGALPPQAPDDSPDEPTPALPPVEPGSVARPLPPPRHLRLTSG
jgi:Polysaccharide lyase